MPQIKITLFDEVNDRRLTLSLPDDVPLEQLIPALARKLSLPEGNYILSEEKNFKPYSEKTTLASSGVGEGASLILNIKKYSVHPKSDGSVQGRPFIDLTTQNQKKKAVQVTVDDQVRNCRLQVILPTTVQVEDLAQRLAREMKLPRGKYEFVLPRRGRFSLQERFSDVHVQSSDTLIFRKFIPDFPPHPTTGEVSDLFSKGVSQTFIFHQYRKSIKIWDELIRIDPNCAATYAYRGWCYFQLGKYRLAINDFTTCLEICPNYITPLRNRANSFAAMKQWQQALEDYVQIAELDPYDLEALDALVGIHMETGNWRQALEIINKIIERKPTSTEYCLKRSVVYEKLGMSAQSQED